MELVLIPMTLSKLLKIYVLLFFIFIFVLFTCKYGIIEVLISGCGDYKKT